MFRRHEDDFEPSEDNYEDDNTEDFIEEMKEAGLDIEGHPGLGKYGIPDAQIYRHSMGFRVFKDVIEAKAMLTTRGELQRLKRQISKYFASGQYQGARILIYGDDEEELLVELRDFCFWFQTRYVIPFGISIKLYGDIV
jgi:hypothetical protein